MPVPAEASAVFGTSIELASRYADVLVTAGVSRGLIGPREIDRIWPRHLINCAVVSELLPDSAHVVDVGSGAGLPGLVLAIRRPDLTLVLLEPLQRRVDFLRETVEVLGLGDHVQVVHGRAEDAAVRERLGAAAWVTARAVAPLDRLVRWCIPLLEPRGTLLAIKGSSAPTEVERHTPEIRRLGGGVPHIVRCGGEVISEPTTVVVVQRAEAGTPARRGQQ